MATGWDSLNRERIPKQARTLWGRGKAGVKRPALIMLS